MRDLVVVDTTRVLCEEDTDEERVAVSSSEGALACGAAHA